MMLRHGHLSTVVYAYRKCTSTYLEFNVGYFNFFLKKLARLSCLHVQPKNIQHNFISPVLGVNKIFNLDVEITV